MLKKFSCGLILASSSFLGLIADGPKDNFPESVRRVPMLGIELTEEQKKGLQQQLLPLSNLCKQIKLSNDPRIKSLSTDVLVFHKALDWSLKHRELLHEREIKWFTPILEEGLNRAKALLDGQAPWLTQKGYIVRGFKSKMDGSIQPYGIEVPESYDAKGNRKHRLDLWLHGRGEKQMELGFIRQRMSQPGKFSPPDTLVLHPYGRYSNAFKFAGEVDVFEALDHAKTWYRVDSNKIANRGFSMGGAGCWQLAVHYPDQWFASNPGAGFSETKDFLETFQSQELNPTWFEKKLWSWYDCTNLVANLKQCPTICYSGEEDRQIQAAQMMEKAHKEEGMILNHVIGPKMGHKYDPISHAKVDKWMIEQAAKQKIKTPREIDFVTYTLKYNKMNWLRIDQLEEHWEKSRIKATLGDQSVTLSTSKVLAFSIDMKIPSNWEKHQSISLMIDQQTLTDKLGTNSKGVWKISLKKTSDGWEIGKSKSKGLVKKNGLQGPIDDAFMDSFIFVPSSNFSNTNLGNWCKSEYERAKTHWRRHFRGDAKVTLDAKLTDHQIKNNNLILWGSPEDNIVLKRIKDLLPIKWDQQKISVQKDLYKGTDYGLIMIYPNPLNPEKYIVLNSSFTFREFAYLNNARQVPMLPDWAIIDLKTKPGTEWPGKVTKANFFDENWQLK